MAYKAPSQKTLLAATIAAAISSQAALAEDSKPGLEEITVTATKREASMQDLALSVTAVSGDQLTELQIVNITDLDKTVPGMQVKNSGNDPVIIMRGAGAAGTNDISVPVYVDSTYRPRAGQGLASFIDVDRVEVLRGPQGTLFGRNTLGGVVNVISKKPTTDEFEFGAATTLGNYGLQKFEGMVNVPMGDKVAMRIAATDTKQDPFVENTYNPAAGLKDADNTYVRAQLAITPNDDLDILLSATYWTDTANGNADYAYKVLGVPVNPATGLTDGINGVLEQRQGTSSTSSGGRPQAGNYPDDWTAGTIADPYLISNDFKPMRDIEETSVSLDVSYDVGFATLRGIFTAFDYEEYRLTDSDLSPNPSANLNDRNLADDYQCVWWYYQPAVDCGLVAGQRVNSKAVQADINLTSDSDGPLNYTLGYYFYDDSGEGDTSGEFVWGYTNAGNPDRPQWAHWLYQGNGGTKSQAVYGQAEYQFNDDLKLTAGVRYSKDERNAYTKNLDTSADGWYSDEGITSPWPDDKYFVLRPTSEVSKGEESHTDYNLAVNYDINDDVMVYGRVSTGYIAGSPVGGGSIQLTPANEVDAFEVGVKSTLLDNSLRINAVAYRNDFTGLSSTYFVEQNGTILARQGYGGDMSSQGAEIEVNWAASDALYITGGVSFDFSELGNFEHRETRFEQDYDTIYNLKGESTRFSPDFTMGIGATYDIDMGDKGLVVPGIFVYHSDSYKTQNENYFFAKQDAFTTVDLRATWSSNANDLSVQAYVKNVTEEVYLTETTVFSRNRAMADYNNPRTYGVRIGYNF